MNKKKIFLVECFLYAFIFAMIALLIFFLFKIFEVKKTSYDIVFRDVDGLSVGSPVKMSGLKIGYVDKITIVDDSVHVSFSVNQKDVFIPQGAHAVVEFYGLGGSKSLEIIPPDSSDERSAMIESLLPYKVSDYYNVSGEINRTLESISVKTSHNLDGFMSSSLMNYPLSKRVNDLNGFIKNTVNGDVIDTLDSFVTDFNKKHKNISSEQAFPIGCSDFQNKENFDVE